MANLSEVVNALKRIEVMLWAISSKLDADTESSSPDSSEPGSAEEGSTMPASDCKTPSTRWMGQHVQPKPS
jgi:hypothetical protein